MRILVAEDDFRLGQSRPNWTFCAMPGLPPVSNRTADIVAGPVRANKRIAERATKGSAIACANGLYQSLSYDCTKWRLSVKHWRSVEGKTCKTDLTDRRSIRVPCIAPTA